VCHQNRSNRPIKSSLIFMQEGAPVNFRPSRYKNQQTS
jgi:hypothetical protein